jgi:hypothetical protein
VRYSTFTHHHVPYSVTFFVDIIYLSNGLFNVLLFSNTRPDLLPHDPPKTEAQLDEVVIRVCPPENEGLGEVNVLTDDVQPHHDSPTNTHGPQFDREGGEAVRLPVGVTYENLRGRSMDSLGRFPFFPNIT